MVGPLSQHVASSIEAVKPQLHTPRRQQKPATAPSASPRRQTTPKADVSRPRTVCLCLVAYCYSSRRRARAAKLARRFTSARNLPVGRRPSHVQVHFQAPTSPEAAATMKIQGSFKNLASAASLPDAGKLPAPARNNRRSHLDPTDASDKELMRDAPPSHRGSRPPPFLARDIGSMGSSTHHVSNFV